MKSRLAVYPGSFDPLTNGHVDIIERGTHLFEKIIVAILVNAEKSPLFTTQERVEIVREAFRGQPSVEVDTFDGLLVDYGAGEPEFPTPEPAKAAAKAAIDQNFTKYTPAAGTADLKQAICARYKADYGVTFTEAETIVTAGGKQALYNIAMVLFNRGDEVITHAPYWPTIPEQVKLAEANPVIVQTKPEDGFAIHPEAILAAITPRTKAVIINSPANPTGAIISEDGLSAIADACAKRGIWVIVDLCYEKLI